jgi:GNAT superfamily N-acetyltransferase
MPSDELVIETLPTDRADSAAELLTCVRAIGVTDNPGEPAKTIGTARMFLSGSQHTESHARVARLNGQLVGFALLYLRHDHYTNTVVVRVGVHPEFRRRGIGGALCADVVEQARALGRGKVEFVAVTRGPASAALAAKLNADAAYLETRSVLDLRALDPARLAELRQGTGRPHGYTMARWIGHCPDELVERYLTAKVSMFDAPQGDRDVEVHRMTAAQLRSIEENHARLGQRTYTVAAIDDASGAMAGFTDIRVLDGGMATQEDTCVVAQHRGHRLGLKASMLEWLLADEPQVTHVQTWNAADNTHMIAINTTLGFRPAEQWQMFQRLV